MEYWRNSPEKRWYKNIKLYALIRLQFFFEGEYCHLCQRRKHFYAKVNMTILKLELIQLVESLQEVTDSYILLLNFDTSIIFGQNSHYFFYEFEKALIYFYVLEVEMCSWMWEIPFTSPYVILSFWHSEPGNISNVQTSDFQIIYCQEGKWVSWNSATDLGKFQIQNKTFTLELRSKVERDFVCLIFVLFLWQDKWKLL